MSRPFRSITTESIHMKALFTENFEFTPYLRARLFMTSCTATIHRIQSFVQFVGHDTFIELPKIQGAVVDDLHYLIDNWHSALSTLHTMQIKIDMNHLNKIFYLQDLLNEGWEDSTTEEVNELLDFVQEDLPDLQDQLKELSEIFELAHG